MDLNDLLHPYSKSEQQKISLAIDLIKTDLPQSKFEHNLRVAKLLVTKKLSYDIIIAGLLHNLFLDGFSKEPELRESFGDDVTESIKEITLVGNIINKNYPKIPAKTMASLVLSITSNLSTLLIQQADLVDRLEFEKSKRMKLLAQLAIEVYSPLAVKLGLDDFNWKLQDFGFRIEKPREYAKVKRLVTKTREEREETVEELREYLEKFLKSKKLTAQVFGRPKNFRSIYKKLQKVSFKQMHDIYGIRIICDKEKECYEILGHIHSKFDFIKYAFDDFIAKEGVGKGYKGYRGIHTAIKKDNNIFEIQIRTWEQHLKSESSIYWEYKRLNKDAFFEKDLSWERQLIEWQKSVGKIITKKGILTKKIFAFTPLNEVIPLPIGSTALDFAFAIHTSVGSKALKAKINGKTMPLDTELNNLDKLEIITSNKQELKRTWLNLVKSDKAKTKIKRFFGINIGKQKKITSKLATVNLKKIKLAECCHPLPGEDVIGVKTTKRKIIIHKTTCSNLKTIDKNKLVEIEFEKAKGQAKIKLTAIDRIGLLGEILAEIKKKNVVLLETNFKIKKSGFVEAHFTIEAKNVQKVEKLINSLEKINAIHHVERE